MPGLWLTGTNGIHMMFMRFPIDAVFLGKPDPGRDGARTVVSVHRGSARLDRRWSRSCAARTASWSCPSARSSGAGRPSATSSPWSRPPQRDRPVTGRYGQESAARHHRLDGHPAPARRSRARSRLPGRLFGLRSRGAAAVRDLPAGARRPARSCRPGRRSGCPPTSPRRSSSSSGARRSPDRSGPPSTT